MTVSGLLRKIDSPEGGPLRILREPPLPHPFFGEIMTQLPSDFVRDFATSWRTIRVSPKNGLTMAVARLRREKTRNYLAVSSIPSHSYHQPDNYAHKTQYFAWARNQKHYLMTHRGVCHAFSFLACLFGEESEVPRYSSFAVWFRRCMWPTRTTHWTSCVM